MKVILDTNVFVSGILSSSGPPQRLFKAWYMQKIHLVASSAILNEYQRISEKLALKQKIQFDPVAELLALGIQIVNPLSLPHQVCDDPDDDKFLACALTSKTKIIVSGDKALLKTSGYCGIQVLSPRRFVDQYL